jgi:hypothetical protein
VGLVVAQLVAILILTAALVLILQTMVVAETALAVVQGAFTLAL